MVPSSKVTDVVFVLNFTHLVILLIFTALQSEQSATILRQISRYFNCGFDLIICKFFADSPMIMGSSDGK